MRVGNASAGGIIPTARLLPPLHPSSGCGVECDRGCFVQPQPLLLHRRPHVRRGASLQSKWTKADDQRLVPPLRPLARTAHKDAAHTLHRSYLRNEQTLLELQVHYSTAQSKWPNSNLNCGDRGPCINIGNGRDFRLRSSCVARIRPQSKSPAHFPMFIHGHRGSSSNSGT